MVFFFIIMTPYVLIREFIRYFLLRYLNIDLYTNEEKIKIFKIQVNKTQLKTPEEKRELEKCREKIELRSLIKETLTNNEHYCRFEVVIPKRTGRKISF